MREAQQATEQRRSELPYELLAGAIGGFAATIPMTAAMQLMHEKLPWWERYPLPPSQIVSRIAAAIGVRQHMDRSEHRTATLVAHFAYGTAAGMIYAPIAARAPLPPALKGIVFGLCVWGTSYLGLLPALGILRPATRHPARRNAVMIVAHVVWGLILGVIAARLTEQE